MKKLGLLGGMTSESTLEYYKELNIELKKKENDLSSIDCIINCVDFSVINTFMQNNEWDKIANILITKTKELEDANCEAFILCTNTIHKISEKLTENTKMHFLHIVDSTGKEIKKMKLKKVGLLGTKFSMKLDFIKSILKDRYDIETIIPNENDMEIVNKLIFDEFAKGIFTENAKNQLLNIISKLEKNSAEGIILGCTELPLIIKQKDVNIPIFDTLKLHVKDAIKYITS